jgi:hypothetical protein
MEASLEEEPGSISELLDEKLIIEEEFKSGGGEKEGHEEVEEKEYLNDDP